jgi:hypothetical protein
MEKVNVKITKNKNINSVTVEKELFVNNLDEVSLKSIDLEHQVDVILNRIKDPSITDSIKQMFFNMIANNSKFTDDLYDKLKQYKTIYGLLTENENMTIEEYYEKKEYKLEYFLFIVIYGKAFFKKYENLYNEFLKDVDIPLPF